MNGRSSLPTEAEINEQLLSVLKLVRELRNAQKEFFRTRSQDVLQAAKQLERSVDQALDEVFDNKPSLF